MKSAQPENMATSATPTDPTAATTPAATNTADAVAVSGAAPLLAAAITAGLCVPLSLYPRALYARVTLPCQARTAKKPHAQPTTMRMIPNSTIMGDYLSIASLRNGTRAATPSASERRTGFAGSASRPLAIWPS